MRYLALLALTAIAACSEGSVNPGLDPYAIGWIKNHLNPESALGRSPWWIGVVIVPLNNNPNQAGVAYQGRIEPGQERCFGTGQLVGERRFAFVAVTDTADPTLASVASILDRLSAGGAPARALADSLMAGQVALPATAVLRHTGLFAPEESQFGNGLTPEQPIVWEWEMADAGWVFREINELPPLYSPHGGGCS